MTSRTDVRDWAALAGQIGGAVTDASRRSRASRDFGGVVRRMPAGIVDATSADHERAVIREARRLGLPLTIQGFGGSVNGQSLAEPGILLRRKESRPAPVRFLDAGKVEISGRSRWWDVETRLRRQGVCTPVLADFLGLTVGGTLSVGGYGFDSIRYGPQVDQVERLLLIKPDGEAVWCSADKNPKLFSHALAGLGQVGLIDKAVIRTVPYNRYTAMYNYAHASMSEMVRSFAWMVDNDEGPEMFKGLYSRGRAVSTYGVGCKSLADVARVEAPKQLSKAPRRFVIPGHRRLRSLLVSAWVASFGRASRMWVDYIFDHDGLVRFVEFLARRIEDDEFDGFLKSVYILGIRQRRRALPIPLEASGAIDAPVTFGVGLYSMVPRTDRKGIDRLRATHAQLLDKCIALGGRPYLYGMHEFSEATLQELYGDDYRALRQLKSELDPDSLFQSHKLIDGTSKL